MPEAKIQLPEELKERIADDPFPNHLGIEVLELRPGYSRVALAVREHMLNMHRITHGGVVFTLADVALGTASNARGVATVAVDVNINFIRSSAAGDYLVATATEENLTRRTGLYRIRVENGRGELVALADGLVYRKEQKGTKVT